MVRKQIVILAAGCALLAVATAAVQPPDAAYLQSFEKWKAELVDDLKQNWLVLAGLFWLKPGANTFGSASDNAIVFPSGPTHAGVFQMQGDEVSVEFQKGAAAKIDGQSPGSAKLQADVTGKPTVIEMGSLRMYVIQRGARLGIRLKDLNSEAARNYAGPMFFPIDMTYRVTGTFVPSDGKKTVDVPNVLGDVTPTPIAGEVHFKVNGQELTLTALSGDPAKGVSFVIGDLTSKTDTYPGGRFLDTDPVVDGKVVLDFNRAYNPPCAVTAYATCPLAPKENRLPVAVSAGEKYDRTHGHH
ncbi:MAG: hypothetical protein JWN74_819 [Acidobacteriaceae bacterium]|nr:hypothetical protein [Acidobacteriaceae bacterium]